MTQSNILVVEDDAALREALCDTLELAGYTVAAVSDGRGALAALASSDTDLVVSDIKMEPMDGQELLRQIREHRPDLPVLLMTAYGTIQQAVEAMRDGASDYLVKPFEAEVLVNLVARYLPQGSGEDGVVAEDPRTRALLEQAARVADSDATVMITGESGTGKEVLARYIHHNSRRTDGPFVAINCAAIPENMLEATLFGYEKGAFTGAYQSCPGKFEQAQSGTLLLDEISEMDLGLQAKLLRVLQEREVERLGARKTIALDVRVLATSNRVLREEVSAGRFREDLFYRLNVFPVHLPPLRERPGDIVPLAMHLIGKHSRSMGRAMPRLTEAAERSLCAHPWPGNVREMDNLLQRALILQRGEVIDASDLVFEQIEGSGVSRPADVGPAATAGEALGEDLKSREQQLIVDALKAERGQRKAAAARLGISERTLRYKLARMREAGVAIPGGDVGFG
jgi:two-component system response regulator FlrC